MTTPLDITNFGAIGDGKFDNAKIINDVLKAAKAQGQSVRVPPEPAVFAHSGVLYVDSATLEGPGTLYALNPLKAAIYLLGAGSIVRNLRLTGATPSDRVGTWEAHHIIAAETHDFRIEGNTIETSAASSIYIRGSTNGLIARNRIIGTVVHGDLEHWNPDTDYTTLRADAIHMTQRSDSILVQGNYIRLPGDDGIACVGYQDDGGPVTNVVAVHNDIANIPYGRGMSANGGHDILYADNQIADIRNAAGIVMAVESYWHNFPSRNVRVRHCTLTNTGGGITGHPSVLVYSDEPANPITDIVFERLVIQNDGNKANVVGIRVRENTQAISLLSNVIVAAPMKLTGDVRLEPYREGAVGVRR